MSVPSRAVSEPLQSGFTYADPDPRLVEYVRNARAFIADGRKLPERLADLTQAAGSLARSGFKLSPCCSQVGDRAYGRNLVYRDPDYGFVVIAMVWPARADSPVHDHGTWCGVAVLEGKVQIDCYEREDGRSAELREAGCCVAGVGETCLIIPPKADVHRVSNPFDVMAVTLHTYGRDITRCSTFDLEGRSRVEEELDYVNLKAARP